MTDQEKLYALSDAFWNAMKNSDGETMYAIADSNCNFVHIGTNDNLDKEVKYGSEEKSVDIAYSIQ